jgi:hypothetical protein
MTLGLFARLLSPVIGAVLVGEPAMRPDPATPWLRTVASGPVPLRTSEPLVAASPDDAVEYLVPRGVASRSGSSMRGIRTPGKDAFCIHRRRSG